jgi:hypothetical protein
LGPELRAARSWPPGPTPPPNQTNLVPGEGQSNDQLEIVATSALPRSPSIDGVLSQRFRPVS